MPSEWAVHVHIYSPDGGLSNLYLAGAGRFLKTTGRLSQAVSYRTKRRAQHVAEQAAQQLAEQYPDDHEIQATPFRL